MDLFKGHLDSLGIFWNLFKPLDSQIPLTKKLYFRWNVKRKWKQAVDFQGLGSDEQLDEAYMDELEQQVLLEIKLFCFIQEEPRA